MWVVVLDGALLVIASRLRTLPSPLLPCISCQTWSYPSCNSWSCNPGVVPPVSNPTCLLSPTFSRSLPILVPPVLRAARRLKHGFCPQQASTGAQREGATGVDQNGPRKQHMCRLWREEPRSVAHAPHVPKHLLTVRHRMGKLECKRPGLQAMQHRLSCHGRIAASNTENGG
jgi:hypothetical protein